LDAGNAALLLGAGLTAGVINTLAGGGSMLTVPLLVLVGLPGGLANGTNRVGIAVQNVTAAWRFRSEGVSGLRPAIPILIPVALGSLVGAFAIAQFSDEAFERVFGLVMLGLLIPMIREALGRSGGGQRRPERPAWSRSTSFAVFFAIGIYGGAIQAGVGIVLILALSRAGHDLVRSNSIKAVIIAALTLIALPVFALERQISWPHALVLAVGFSLGGVIGARLAVAGGERLIRPVLIAAVAALSGRMLGVY